jgi:hypothetical protein
MVDMYLLDLSISGNPGPPKVAPEWQQGSYRYLCRLAGGLSTLGACSKVSLLNRQRLWTFDSPERLLVYSEKG